jgi:hypothetical protein
MPDVRRAVRAPAADERCSPSRRMPRWPRRCGAAAVDVRCGGWRTARTSTGLGSRRRVLRRKLRLPSLSSATRCRRGVSSTVTVDDPPRWPISASAPSAWTSVLGSPRWSRRCSTTEPPAGSAQRGPRDCVRSTSSSSSTSSSCTTRPAERIAAVSSRSQVAVTAGSPSTGSSAMIGALRASASR